MSVWAMKYISVLFLFIKFVQLKEKTSSWQSTTICLPSRWNILTRQTHKQWGKYPWLFLGKTYSGTWEKITNRNNQSLTVCNHTVFAKWGSTSFIWWVNTRTINCICCLFPAKKSIWFYSMAVALDYVDVYIVYIMTLHWNTFNENSWV